MSFTKRLIDLARSNLNALLERAADSADPRRKLADVTDSELEAELARRKAAREVEGRFRDAKARVGVGDRETREREARERIERVKREREARARAAGEAARAAGARGPGAGSSARPSGSGWSGSAASSGSAAGSGRAPRNPELKKYYDRLELQPGATFDEVRAAYRRLMRRYHPDLHANKSPDKQRAAHEVSAALTQAYNELEKALGGK